MVKRRLVFHFYANEGWGDNVANVCHFNCLKAFSGVFTDAVVTIANDSLSLAEIKAVERRFIDSLDIDTITFKIVENTPYYEADTFNREIIGGAANFDGLSFFAHNKGVTNVMDPAKSKTAILSWICALYFYGLRFVDEAERELCSNNSSVFYGPYLMTDTYIANKHHMWYAGTFYWVNANRLLKWTENIPPMCDREYAEWLPGELFGSDRLKSHGNIILPDSDLYRNWQFASLLSALSKGEYDEFLEFKKNAMDGFSEYKYTILTYNFGNYEIMREIEGKQNDVEYIYVTDDKTLTSKTWTVVYDERLEGLDVYEKVLRVRENPFEYCSTTTCVRIDASIWVTGSIDKLVEDFHIANSDIGVMVHPERDNVYDEYEKWITFRGCNRAEKDAVIESLKRHGCDLEMKGLYEVGLTIYVNNRYTNAFLKKYSEILSAVIGDCGRIRVDQVVFSAVLNTFANAYIFPISHACIQSKSLLSMEHNSCFTCVVNDIPDTGYVRGIEKTLYKI